MKTAILASLFACAGCVSAGWTHPTKSQSDYPIDSYDCEKESVAMYPPVFVADEKQFGGHKDLNGSDRRDAWRLCLEARGWK